MSADHHPNEATPQTETASRLPATPTAGHSARVVSIAFSPDGRLLATGSRDTSMRLWDAQSGELLSGPMVGDVVRGAHVFDVTFSPDSKVVATAVRDGTVCLWDTENHTAIGSPLTGHSSWVHDVSFHPNGKWLASASKDHTVRVWDVSVLLQNQDPSSAAKCINILEEHQGAVQGVSFCPMGDRLASLGEDGRVRLVRFSRCKISEAREAPEGIVEPWLFVFCGCA